MTKRQAIKLLPTMKVKADPNEELDMEFQEIQGEIVSVEDVETKNFGEKVKATLKHEGIGEFQVFINNVSMEKLIEAFGDDDDTWKGKLVDLKKETDAKYKTEMIVMYPVA